MSTKRTRNIRRLSNLKFNMALMDIRQENLSMIVNDALFRMHIKIEQLELEVQKLKEEREY